MPVLRLPKLPDLVTQTMTGKQTLYTVTLSAAPSPEWRAAFLRPPPTLTTMTYWPEFCRLDLQGATVLFRPGRPSSGTAYAGSTAGVAYANSVVEE